MVDAGLLLNQGGAELSVMGQEISPAGLQMEERENEDQRGFYDQALAFLYELALTFCPHLPNVERRGTFPLKDP